MPIRNTWPLQKLPEVSLKWTKARDLFNWYETREFCTLVALLTVGGVWSILQGGKRASISPLKITPICHLVLMLTYYGEEGSRLHVPLALPITGHDAASCGTATAAVGRAHSGLSQSPSAAYQPCMTHSRSSSALDSPLVMDSCHCFRVELLAAGINSMSHKQGLAFSSLPGHTGVFSATAVATKVFLIEICGVSE